MPCLDRTTVIMDGLLIEYRACTTSLSRDLARQIQERSLYGKIVVAAKNPISSLSTVRKQWLQILRSTQIERARTLNQKRISELTHEFARLQTMVFSMKATNEPSRKDVIFATADELARVAPACSTLFVTYDFPREQLHLMTSWMPSSCLVVIYEQ